MSSSLDAIVLAPPALPPTASVIWLHGLGADGYDFVPVVRQLDLPGRGIRTTLPHAPTRPVTINGGYVMRAWYDVLDMDLTRRPDAAGIRDAAARVAELVAREMADGVPAERVVLAGFSQGGAVALQAGLRYPARLAGIIALSCYQPLPETAAAEASPGNLGLPIFMGHGDADAVIPLRQGQNSARILESLGYRVEFRTYPMPHGVCAEEVADIDRWLARVLA